MFRPGTGHAALLLRARRARGRWRRCRAGWAIGRSRRLTQPSAAGLGRRSVGSISSRDARTRSPDREHLPRCCVDVVDPESRDVLVIDHDHHAHAARDEVPGSTRTSPSRGRDRSCPGSRAGRGRRRRRPRGPSPGTCRRTCRSCAYGFSGLPCAGLEADGRGTGDMRGERRRRALMSSILCAYGLPRAGLGADGRGTGTCGGAAAEGVDVDYPRHQRAVRGFTTVQGISCASSLPPPSLHHPGPGIAYVVARAVAGGRSEGLAAAWVPESAVCSTFSRPHGARLLPARRRAAPAPGHGLPPRASLAGGHRGARVQGARFNPFWELSRRESRTVTSNGW